MGEMAGGLILHVGIVSIYRLSMLIGRSKGDWSVAESVLTTSLMDFLGEREVVRDERFGL